MTAFEIIALLLTLAAFGAYVNHRFLKLPATIGLMLVALVVSSTAIGLNSLGLLNLNETKLFVAQIDFPALLLHGMLSLLLFAGALQVDINMLRKYQIIVGSLATVGVVLATFITGTLIWYAAGALGFHFPYIYALLFGALISPTDPVAVLGILKNSEVRKSLRLKIGCESLLNDGVAVVLFMILLTTADPNKINFTPPEIVMLLIWEGLGSIILGLTLGWLTCQLLRAIDDYKVEVFLTLALATGGYVLAEAVHVSAPITIVIAGLFIGNEARTTGMSEKTRVHLDVFWELIDEILNAVLFVLIGLQLMVINLNSSYLAAGLAAIIAVLVGRFLSVSIPVSLLSFRYKFERGTIPFLTWGGLRGGISIALALSLPAGMERDLILAMTYITVLFSVLFQGTTFRHIVHLIVKDKD
jgi:monovalent cation:H+ antiporter, CPA1 family